MNNEVVLTKGENEILKQMEKLENLWKKHGKNLVLFNGQSVRYKGRGAKAEIAFFGGIIGDGGDGGDDFE